VRSLLPILHALATAHQKGIVHRDLKPENIFLCTTDGGYVQPKLVDFGIVQTGAPELDRLTHMGTVLGTPAYLSPQQARGEDVDQRTDVCQIGAVALAIVLRRPLSADEYASTRHARFEPRRDGVYIEDIGSTNGTFVNGIRLTRDRKLTPGDVVRIGETDLRFEP